MRGSQKKICASILCFTMALYPLYPYADIISDTGRAGQAEAQAQADAYNQIQLQNNNGSLTIPSVSNGTFSTSGGSQININDLFPGTSSSGSGNLGQYFPTDATPDVSNLRGISGEGDSMDSMGQQFKQSLFTDSTSATPTMTGSAYGVMIQSLNKPKPDLSNDPTFNTTKNIFSNIDAISASFADCSTSTTFQQITNTKHVPEYHQCESIIDKSATCTVTHSYDAGVVKHSTGPYNLLPLSNSALQLWIGTVGNNYYQGNCTVFEDVTQVVVTNPAAITRVTLNRVVWDDHIQVWAGKPGAEVQVWSSGQFPPETPGTCDLDRSNDQDVSVDLTNIFKNGVHAGDLINLRIRVSVGGWGEGYASAVIDYDPAKAVFQDVWTPQDCIDATQGIYDGFAHGSVTCTAMPSLDAGGCTNIEGVTVCNGNLTPSPLRNIQPLCQSVSVVANYDYYKTNLDCYTAADGSQVCPTSGANTNTCAQYQANNKCRFVSSQCADGATAASSGICYITDQTWDCGEDVVVPDYTSETNIDCAGPVRCMGSDCLDPNKTQSPSFAKAVAALNAAQFMTQDMNCTSNNGTADVTCKVFSGTPYNCKVAVGGVQDCCDVPTNVSAGTYIQGILMVGKLDSTLMGMDSNSAVRGAYQTLREPVMNTVSTVTKPFTSYTENISGTVSEYTESLNAFVDEIEKQIKDAITKTIDDMLGQAGTDMGTTAAESGATQQVAQEQSATAGQQIVADITSAASTVMAAYTAYVVAVMVIQSIYKCETAEFELAAKKDTKSCNYIGSYCSQEVLGICMERQESYCCFNSPLSRIINAQIRPQLGRNFGSAENPDCQGIEMDQIANIDWSLVDLSEWTTMLAQYHLSPDPTLMNMTTLTGSGSDWKVLDPNRLDVGQRTTERFNGIDVDAIRREAQSHTAVDTNGTAP